MEGDYATGELRINERGLAADEFYVVEEDLTAGELRGQERNPTAGEFRATERDEAISEFRAEERDLTASELRATEITTIERGVREVKVTTTPGDRSVGLSKMIANEADDGVPDFRLTFAVLPASSIWLVRHAQVGAQDIDANLTLLTPVVSESGHGVDTSEAHRSFVVPELVGGCRITLSKLIGVGSMRVSLDESLLAVAIDANKNGTDEPGNGDRSLDDVERIDRSWPTVGPGTWHSDRPQLQVNDPR
ncbi:MAG: hypothetical protein M3Y48_14295 [Actinomycetota bacterium]|nr:hypothetical protein [Actinomycetota bacterium]